MHTPTNLEYIKEKYRELGKPVPKMLELLSEVYGHSNGKSISGEDIFILLLRLCKSYECYTAINKPKVEWDEYDQMILPVWIELANLMEIPNELS